MKLGALFTASVVVGVYAIAALVATCSSCAVRVGDATCTEYVRALEVRLTECELSPDAWYHEQLRKVYAQCEGGALGIVVMDAVKAPRIRSRGAAKPLARPLPCPDCGCPLRDGACPACPRDRDEHDPIDDRSDIR